MVFPCAQAAIGKPALAAAARTVFLPLILAVWIALGGCERVSTATRSHVETEPAERPAVVGQPVAEETPLLLDDEPLPLSDGDDDASEGPVADNSRCFVCHVNYMEEQIAVTHARANLGCAACHGPSDAHIADESWASGGNGTAPDIMFPRDKINPACMACHTREKLDSPQHAMLFVGASQGKVCTDCHGNHRLPQRRCKWK